MRLEPKAMNVLRVLAGTPGDVVSRQSLLDEVWPGQEITDDVLTTVVSTLRRHLGDNSRESRFIETVPKRGYRLIAPVVPAMNDSRATAPAAGSVDTEARRPRHAVWLGVMVIIILLAVLVGRSFQNTAPRPVADVGSIAVLPFDVFGDDPKLQYFAEGLVEELIHQLAADPELKVTSRTSSSRVSQDLQSIGEIGEKLGVRNVLEGSIRGDETLLRVTVQMIDAQADAHQWSRVFDVESGELLLMQEKVSNDVVSLVSGAREANMLQTRLRHPVPNEAYRLYLLGQSLMRVGTVDSYARAVDYFSDALRIAPDYPLALVQYAAARLFLFQYRRDELGEATDAARDALDRALKLDPELAEAQVAYGLLYTYNKQFEAAEPYFQSALKMRPNMSYALHNYAFLLWSQGRMAEVIEPARQTIEIDPISPGAYFLLSDSLANMGRFDEALEAYEHCNEAIPDSRSCLLGQASVERILGHVDAAQELVDRALEHIPADYVWLVTTQLGLALYRHDYEGAGALYEKVSREIPDENYVLRAGLLLAQQRGRLGPFLTGLQVQRERMEALDQSTESLDWVEAHARYLQDDCERALELYEQMFNTGYDFIRSHWSLEFGHSHLTNLIYCAEKTGRAPGAAQVAEYSEELLRGEQVLDYPAGRYLLAKLYRLEGDEARAAATLEQLESEGWPFLWLVDQEPAFGR